MSSGSDRQDSASSPTAQEHIRQAVACANSQQWGEAIQWYDRALAMAPDQDQIVIAKGAALAQLGKSEEAVACFDTVLGRNPQSTEAWFDKGVVLFKLSRYEEAKHCFQQAAQLGHAKAPSAIARCDTGTFFRRQARRLGAHGEIFSLETLALQ